MRGRRALAVAAGTLRQHINLDPFWARFYLDAALELDAITALALLKPGILRRPL